MNILAIDTSCDETSVAVVQNDSILSNIISSQIDLHRKWGGVVPDIAKRAHKENIDGVISEAISRSHLSLDRIEAFAATYGPGLAPSLEVGLKKAQELAISRNKPFIPINHLEGHLLSSFAKNSKGKNPHAPTFRDLPAIALLVSGGHTELIYVKEIGNYVVIGETLDDAAGEAFDKLAKMLDLGYPGGPIISEFAKKGTPGRFQLPIPMEKSGDLNFSFSGLKTACLYKIEALKKNSATSRSWVFDFCSDFVESVTKALIVKLDKAVTQYRVNGVFLGGGVISNEYLRRKIRSTMKKRGLRVFIPYSSTLFTDNAAMIGVAAYYAICRNSSKVAFGDSIRSIERNPVASISD